MDGWLDSVGLVLSHIGQNKRGAPPWAIKGRGGGVPPLVEKYI